MTSQILCKMGLIALIVGANLTCGSVIHTPTTVSHPAQIDPRPGALP